MSEAATETSCFGETSIRSTLSVAVSVYSPGLAGVDHLVFELALGVEFCIRLGDHVTHFFGRGHVLDFVGHLAVFDLTIGRFDEAVLVHTGKGRQRC